MKTVDTFCQVHDFWRRFQPQWRQCLLTSGYRCLQPSRLCMSEAMAILIMLHLSGYRTFKDCYQLAGAMTFPARPARRDRTSAGWFSGFKLPLAINHEGELLSCCLTPGNTDDRIEPLVAKLRGNMKRRLLPLWQRLMLGKRDLLESVIDFLKDTCHRSRGNWLANLLSGLAAYSFLSNKPALKLNLEPQFDNLLCLI